MANNEIFSWDDSPWGDSLWSDFPKENSSDVDFLKDDFLKDDFPKDDFLWDDSPKEDSPEEDFPDHLDVGFFTFIDEECVQCKKCSSWFFTHWTAFFCESCTEMIVIEAPSSSKDSGPNTCIDTEESASSEDLDITPCINAKENSLFIDLTGKDAILVEQDGKRRKIGA